VCWDTSLQRSRVWVLESAGLEVRSACTPEDAVAALARHRFEVVVLGHSLTRQEKLELLRLGRAAGAAVIALRRADTSAEPEFDASVDSTSGPEGMITAIQGLQHRRARAAGA
jgi:DNA-binding NtrC family response regulator